MSRIASDPRLANVQLPDPHLTLRQRLPEVEPRLLALIYCCLQPDPQLRPTAAELLQMVRRPEGQEYRKTGTGITSVVEVRGPGSGVRGPGSGVRGAHTQWAGSL